MTERAPETGRAAPAALVAFIACGVLAGGNPVAVVYSNRELAPIWGAGLRFGLAAALLLAAMGALRHAAPRGRALAGALLYGLLNFAGAFAFAYYGLVRMPAGLGGPLLALVPLVTLLLGVAQGEERFRPAAVLGSAFAVAGVAVVSRASLGQGVPLLSLLALLASVACFAEAAVLVRRFPQVHPVPMNAIGMGIAALVLIPASFVLGEPIQLPTRTETWAALGYLVPIGSIAVFVLYIVVLRYWEASRAVYIDVMIPIITVGLAAWLLDEEVGWELVVGGALIVAGVYIGALRASPSPP